MRLNVNTDAVVQHAARLERFNRSAMPVAVRQTLNSAAFDAKQKTMPAQAARTFEKRDKNFFRANSKVQTAHGFDINTMRATVGFKPLGGTNKAVEDLEQQEYGGKIGGRTFIPLAQARTGNSWRRKVRRTARISQIKNIVDAADAKGSSKKEKFIKSCIHAGVGGWVIGDTTTAGGNRILYQVRSIKRIKGDTVVKVVPMFAVQPQNTVTAKPTKFMQKATLESGKKMEQYFIKHAEAQIKKLR